MGILGGIAAPAVSGRTGDGHRCDSRRFGPSACYAYSVCRRFDPGDLRPHVGGLAWQRVMVLTQMSEIAMFRQLSPFAEIVYRNARGVFHAHSHAVSATWGLRSCPKP